MEQLHKVALGLTREGAIAAGQSADNNDELAVPSVLLSLGVRRKLLDNKAASVKVGGGTAAADRGDGGGLELTGSSFTTLDDPLT